MIGAIILIVAALTTPPSAALDANGTQPASQPATQPDAWFEAPEDWSIQRRNRVVFLDSPEEEGAPSARIALLPKMKFAGRQGDLTFEDWFGLVQQPDPIISQGKLERSKDAAGRPTLRLTKTVEDGGQTVHRVYYAVRDDDEALLVLLTVVPAEQTEPFVVTFDKFVKSIDVEQAPPSHP